MKKSSTSERLKFLMETENLKQIDIINKCKPFSEKYGVKLGRNDISQYVSGKVQPAQNKLTVLASGLGVDEAWLMGYDVPINALVKYNEELASSYKSGALVDVFSSFGYEEFKIVSIYSNLPSDGKKEYLNFTDYLMNKYNIQIESKEQMQKDFDEISGVKYD